MKQRTDAERKRIVEEIQKKIATTDLSIKEICSGFDISDSSFYTWRKMCSDKSHKQQNTNDDEKPDPEALIVELKTRRPYYGQQKIVKQLEHSHGIKVKRSQVDAVLAKHGLKETSGHKKRRKGRRRFERVEPMDLLQLDVMYYTLKNNRRFYLLTVLDDHSRYVVAYKLTTSQTADKAIDVLTRAVEEYGRPRQVLTDRGSQFHAWKGTSRFDKLVKRLGIEHILTSPQSPQTIGKIESWHRNIQRELLGCRELGSVEAAREAIAEYVDFYNHERVHMALDYATPADRFFGVDTELEQIKSREGDQFYLTARIDGQPLRLTPNGEDMAQVHLAGKEIKEVRISELKQLLL